MVKITTDRSFVAFGGLCTMDGDVSYWSTGPFAIPGGGGIQDSPVEEPLYLREAAFVFENAAGDRFETRIDISRDGIGHQGTALDG